MADTKLDILINAAVNGVDQIKSLSKEITDVNSNVAQTAQTSTVAGSFFDTLSQAAKELSASLTGSNQATNEQAEASKNANISLAPLAGLMNQNVNSANAKTGAFELLTLAIDKYKTQILLATTALGGYLAIEGTIASANAAKEYNKLGDDLYEVALASGITKDKLKEYENELIKTGLTSTQAREQLKEFIDAQLESGNAVDNFGESILEFAKNVEKEFDTLEELETYYEDLRKVQGDSVALTKEYEQDLLNFNRALLSDFEKVEQKQERIQALQADLLANIGKTFLPMKEAIDANYKTSLDIISNFLIEVNKVVDEFDKTGEFANILGSMFKESSVILQGVSDVLLGVIRYIGSAGNEFVTMAKTINRALSEIKEFASNSFGFVKESVVDLFNSISINLIQSSTSINGFSNSLSTSFDSNSIQTFLLNLKELIPSFEELNLFADSFYDVAISAIEQAGTSIREYGEEISGTGKEIESLVEPIKDVANTLTKANSFTQWIRDAIAFIKPVTDVIYSLDGLDKELASIQGQLDVTSKALTVAANTAKPVASEMQNLGNFLQFLGGGLENTSENISYLSNNFGLASDSLGGFEKDLKELVSLSGFANDLVVRLKDSMVFSNEETVLAKLNNDLKTILDSGAVQDFILDFTSGFAAISENFNGFLSEISEFSSNLTGFFSDLIEKSSVLSESFKFVSENGSLLGGVFYTIGFAINGLKDGFDVIISSLAMFGSKVLYTFSFVLDGVAKAVRVFSEEKANYLNRSADDLRAFSEKATQSATQVFEKIADGKGALQDYVNGIDDAATAMSKTNPSFNKLEENIANVANMWQAGTLAADDYQEKLDELTESVEKAGKESKISEAEMKKLTDSINKMESTETDRFNNAMAGMKVSIREVATTAEDGENKTVEFLDTTGLSATKNGKAIKEAISGFADNLETVAVSAKGTEEIFKQAFSKGLDISKTILDLSKFNGALEQAKQRGFEVGESLDLLRGRFYGLLDNTLKTAKTTEDFEQVRVALTNMRNTGVISATDLTNAQEKLRAKIKEVADETKNADISNALKELGTSYQEFSTGISDAAAKRAVALQQLTRGLAEKAKAEIEAKEAAKESTESDDAATESEGKEAEAVEKTTEKVKEKTKETEKATEKEKEKSDAVVDGTNKEVAAIEKQIKSIKDRVAVTNEEIDAKNREIAVYERLKKAKEEQIELDKQSLDDAKSLVASETIFGGKDFSFTTETSDDISSEKTIKDWDNIENKVLSLNNVLNTTKDTIKQTTTAISEFANPQPINLFEQNTSNKLEGVSVVFKETVGQLPNVFNREVDNLEQTVTDFVRQTSVTGKTNQAIQGFFNAIKEGATNSGEAIKEGLSTAFETLNDTILDKELAVFDDFFEEISDKAEKEANLLISAFAGLSDVKALEEIADNADEGADNIKKEVESVKELTNETSRLAVIQKTIKDNKPNVEQATGGSLAGQSEYNQGEPDWAKRLLEINEQVKSGKSVVNEVAGTTEFLGGDQGARLTQLDNEFKAIAKARKEADALYEVLNKEINTAKTLEELGNVNKQILDAKENGTLFGEALTGALQQVTLKFDSLLESQLKNAKTKEDYDILTRKVQELGSTGTITGQQMALAFDKIKEKQTGAREETLRNSQQMTELASASARLNSATIASRKAEIDIEKAKQTVIAAEEKVRKNGTEASKAELAVAKANLELAEERGRLSAIKYREELANMDLVKAKQAQINAEKARALNPADVNLNAAVDAANREVEARQLVVENIKQAVIAQEQLVAQTELGVTEAQQLAAANTEAAGAAKGEQPTQGGGGGGSFVYTTRTSFQKQMEEITGQKDTGQYQQIFQGSANKDGGFWNIGEGAARQALAVKTLEEAKQKTEENKKAAEEMATAYEKSKNEINQAKTGVSLLTESQAAALGLSKEMADSYNKIRQDAMNLYKESEESFKSFSKSMVDIANESSDQERSQIDLIKEKAEQRKQDLALSKQELDLKLQLALVSAKAAGLTDQEAAISKMMQKTNDQYVQALGNLDKIAAKEIESGKNKEFIDREKLQGEIDAREFERNKKKNEELAKLEKTHIDDVRKHEDQLLDNQSKKLATVQKERMDKELAMRTSILDAERQKRKEIEDGVKANEDANLLAMRNRIETDKKARLDLLEIDRQSALQSLDNDSKKEKIELEKRRNLIESQFNAQLQQATSEPQKTEIEKNKKNALLDLEKESIAIDERSNETKKRDAEKARVAELAEKEKQAAEEKLLADQKAAIELQRQERAKKELETQRIEALQFEDAKRKLEKLKQDEDLAFQKQKDVLLEQRRKDDLEFEQKKQAAQRAFDAEKEYRALKLKAIESGVNLGTIEDIKKSAGGDLSKMVESGDSKASEAYFDKLYKIQELIDQKMMSKLQSFNPPKTEIEKAATRGEANLGSFAKGDVVELNLNLGGQRITTYAPKEQSNGNLMDLLNQFRLQTA